MLDVLSSLNEQPETVTKPVHLRAGVWTVDAVGRHTPHKSCHRPIPGGSGGPVHAVSVSAAVACVLLVVYNDLARYLRRR